MGGGQTWSIRLCACSLETAGAGSSVNRRVPRCGRAILDTPAISVNVAALVVVRSSIQGEHPEWDVGESLSNAQIARVHG